MCRYENNKLDKLINKDSILLFLIAYLLLLESFILSRVSKLRIKDSRFLTLVRNLGMSIKTLI